MGGAGAFLSIPALCMWDVPTTGAFLLALQLGGVWERIKVSAAFSNATQTLLFSPSDAPLMSHLRSHHPQTAPTPHSGPHFCPFGMRLARYVVLRPFP
jgi:hypothetical protein